jgi:hypothetical protein
MSKEEEEKQKKQQKEKEDSKLATEEKVKKQELILKEQNNVELTKIDNFKSVEDMLAFADYLIKGKLIPNTLNTPEKVVTVVQQGRELGIGAVSALNNLHNIQGKVAIGVHLYTALARARAGIDWELINDCDYIFPDGFINPFTSSELAKEHGGTPIDKICKIKFYRYNKVLDRVISNTLSFTIGEATKQGLMEKDNWKKMGNIMLRSRTLVLGIRFVGSDTFMGGLYETSEMLDSMGKSYDVDNTGEVINI